MSWLKYIWKLLLYVFYEKNWAFEAKSIKLRSFWNRVWAGIWNSLMKLLLCSLEENDIFFMSLDTVEIQILWILKLKKWQYFNSHSHCLNELHYMGIEIVKMSQRAGNNDRILLQREAYWIHCLDTLIPNGMNEEISFACFYEVYIICVGLSCFNILHHETLGPERLWLPLLECTYWDAGCAHL